MYTTDRTNLLDQPPLKRRRLSTQLSQSIHRFNGPQHPVTTNTTNHNLNTHHQHQSNNLENDQLRSFKSQLKEILELLPPFKDFIATQMDPNHLFEQLYQIFVAYPQPQMPSYPQIPIRYDIESILPSRNTQPIHNDPSNIHPFLANYPTSNHNINEQSPNPLDFVPLMDMDDDHYSLGMIPANFIKVWNSAKDTMMKKMYRNMDLRCNKVIESLNKITKNNPKCCALLKQFTMNVVIQREIGHGMAKTLSVWHGGKTLQQAKTLSEQQAFKLVRGHWNRQKAQVLGDSLYCLVLQNLFKIASQIAELSCKEQLYFYIDLFCGLLSDEIQFEQSMPRPLIPNACFDKSLEFKKLCGNILKSFSTGTIRMVQIQTTETRKENGKKVTKYIRHGNRSKYLAESYFNSLQDLKPIIMNASNDFIQHSIQMHLSFLRQSKYFQVNLMQWGMMPPAVN